MRRTLIITVALVAFFSLQLSAQLPTDSLSIGKRTDGSELKAFCVQFKERIQSVTLDPSKEYLCLNFRGTSSSGKYLKNKGEVGLYRISDGKLMWRTPVNSSLHELPVRQTVYCLLPPIKRGYLINKREPRSGRCIDYSRGCLYVI